MRVFLAIARNGSLGAAAKHLGVSHPTVGRRLLCLNRQAEKCFFVVLRKDWY